jgi:hypothetical protein
MRQISLLTAVSDDVIAGWGTARQGSSVSQKVSNRIISYNLAKYNYFFNKKGC